MSNELSGKRIALVGGAGFIGHTLALKLKELGAEPHVVDSLQVNNLGAFTHGADLNPNANLYVNFINQRLDLLRDAEIPLHVVDARDYQVLGPHLKHIEPSVVVHLAAVAHANRANKDPYHTLDHSMHTLENALDTIRYDKPHFIFFSSSMVYGNFDGDAVSEDRRCDPMGIYGAVKYSGETIVKAYKQVFDVPYTIIRPSALYGERCVSRRVGQAFIENAISGKNLTLNGDGTDALDFTYIDDLIQGLVLCISNEKAKNEVFNLTFGSGRQLNDMAAMVQASFPEIDIEYQKRDALMPERGTLCIDKAKELLGYQPAYPLEKGFVSYIKWYKEMAEKHPGLFNR